MSVEFAGLTAGTLLETQALVRATFAPTLAGALLYAGETSDNLRRLYSTLQETAPNSVGGFVASSLNVTPDSKALVVDFRMRYGGQRLEAGQVASALDELAGIGFEVTRLALVGAGEGAAAAAAHRDEAVTAEADKPGILEAAGGVLEGLQSFGKWFVALLLALAVILLVYFFRPR